jgi:hypothetical protein
MTVAPVSVEERMIAGEPCVVDDFWPVIGSAAVANSAPQKNIAAQAANEKFHRALMIYPF